MSQCRRRFQGEPPITHYWDFRDLLLFEKERSERHNRFFTLFGITLSGSFGEELISTLRRHLRLSDYVFSVPSSKNGGYLPQDLQKIGVLLPETDQKGACTVQKRLIYLCNLQALEVHIGLSVYPDDATIPDQLLSLAFDQGRPIGQTHLIGGLAENEK